MAFKSRIWRTASGKVPAVDSDGIRLTPQRDYVYFHATTARTLYRVPASALTDASLTDTQVAQRVERVAETDPTDGILFDRNGNLYLTYVQQNAVERYTPGGQLQRVVSDLQLRWPDSFAAGPDSAIYVTTSQLHSTRAERTEPYQIFKFRVPNQ